MKQRYSIVVVIAVMIFTVGCESNVYFRDKASSSKVVLNSIINCTADTNVIKLSESVSLFSGKEAEIVENSDLRLNINGLENAITFNGYRKKHGYYGFVSSLKPGDKVELSGYTTEHGSFSGFDYVPSPPEIVSVNTEWFKGEVDNFSYLRTLVKIKDNPSIQNYYRIVIRGKTLFDLNENESDWPWNQLDVCTDQEIVFNNISGIGGENEDAYAYRIFSDDLFQGKEYTLNVYVRKDRFDISGYENTRHYIKVEVHALSENLYKYLRSLELALIEDRFQEPVKVYTNIDGGYGILGVYNIDEQVIKVMK